MQLFPPKRDFAFIGATLLALAPFPIYCLPSDAAIFFQKGHNSNSALYGALGAVASLITIIAVLAVVPRLLRVRRFRKKILRLRRKSDPKSIQRLSVVQIDIRKAYAMKRITKDDFDALKELAEI
jgi:hypothetical protein